MLTRNKPFPTFNGTKQAFAFVRVDSVLNVLLVRKQFQIVNTVIGAVKVFMVDFQATFNRPNKGFPQSSMQRNPSVFSILARSKTQIMVRTSGCFNFSILRIALPCLSVFYHTGGGYASAKKFRNLTKKSAVCKHLFCDRNFCSVKFFSPANTPHAGKITDFVKTLVANNWLPCFHAIPPFKLNWNIA